MAPFLFIIACHVILFSVMWEKLHMQCFLSLAMAIFTWPRDIAGLKWCLILVNIFPHLCYIDSVFSWRFRCIFHFGKNYDYFKEFIINHSIFFDLRYVLVYFPWSFEMIDRKISDSNGKYPSMLYQLELSIWTTRSCHTGITHLEQYFKCLLPLTKPWHFHLWFWNELSHFSQAATQGNALLRWNRSKKIIIK